MYLDFSAKKIALLGSIILVLCIFVYITNVEKVRMFGSTPYFYTITEGSKYALRTLIAIIMPHAPVPQSDTKAASIPVLTYHRVLETDDVNNVSLKRFREQMTTLKDAGWNAVSLQDFEDFMAGKKEIPEKSFLLTFDDGAKQSFYPVDPILRYLGYHAAIFIIVQSSKTLESTYYLTPEEIRFMLGTGRWAIGSHSYDGHRPYPTDAAGTTGIFFADLLWQADAMRLETPDEFAARVRDDLTHAKKELEDAYKVPVTTFAFPLGNESGIEGANNFKGGASTTEDIARSIYSVGFVQTNDQTFTFNFPTLPTRLFMPAFSTTTTVLATHFLVHRIHVDYDWDGQRLLSLLENGRAKPLPYEDDFSNDRGWISAWGSLEIGRNNFALRAEPTLTSASSFLDGTALWDDYSFETSANWHAGYALVLADVVDSKTYHACAFSDGAVRIQKVTDGVTETLAYAKNAAIGYGDAVHIGVRVHGNVIECTWNFTSVLEDYTRDFSGGIGIQTWDANPGSAQLQVSSIIVRPYATSSTP